MSKLSLKIFNGLFPDDKTCVQFLANHGVFYETINCPACNNAMDRNLELMAFRCTKWNCTRRGRISLRRHTFFFGSALKCIDIMGLSQMWLAKASVDTCITLTGHSSSTVCAFYKHFRQLVSSALKPEDQIIGGPGIIVEVDETKLGKRKYHRGHHVEGVWVLVGIEQRENGKIFLVPVPDRSGPTLDALVSRHVLPGSTVHTDMWPGYSNLSALGFVHQTVNHKLFFKDPVTQVCTNTAEGLNSGLKRRIPVRNRVSNSIEEHLGEYIWRRQNKERIFDAFIEALRDIHYDNE